jgi:hypothetical protein
VAVQECEVVRMEVDEELGGLLACGQGGPDVGLDQFAV